MSSIRALTIALILAFCLGPSAGISAQKSKQEKQHRQEQVARRQQSAQSHGKKNRSAKKSRDGNAGKKSQRAKKDGGGGKKKSQAKSKSKSDSKKKAKTHKKHDEWKRKNADVHYYHRGRGYRYGRPYPYDRSGSFFGLTIVPGRPYYEEVPVERYPIEVEVQVALARAGFYRGPIDGIVGRGTQHAIYQYQMAAGLRPTGNINRELLISLGLR